MSDQYSAKANKLLLEALEKDQPAYLTVKSDSMAPLFRTGDQLQIAALTGERPKIGDVIVFGQLEDLIAHRFWGVLTVNDRAYLLARGDRLPYFDPYVAKNQVRAVVVGRRRSDRLLSIDRGTGAVLNRCLNHLVHLEAQTLKIPLPTGTLEPGEVAGGRLWARFVRRLLYIVASVLTSLASVFSV